MHVVRKKNVFPNICGFRVVSNGCYKKKKIATFLFFLFLVFFFSSLFAIKDKHCADAFIEKSCACFISMPVTSSGLLFRCNGLKETCTKTAVHHFRQKGILLVDNFLPPRLVQQLSTACTTAFKARGPQVFPARDPEHDGSIQFDMQCKPKASANLSDLPPPEDMKKVLKDNDAKKALDYHVRKVDLKCKNQRKVDLLYRKLVKRRNHYHRFKSIPTVITEREELSGEISDSRIEEIKNKFSYDTVKSGFEKYRDDGKLELEIRRDNYIDETLQYLENWGRFAMGFWPTLPSDIRKELSALIGEATTSLNGEVCARLFSDTLQEHVSFTNGTPFHCCATGLNFKHPSTVTVALQLEGKYGQTKKDVRTRQVVVPGSHRALLELTDDGLNFSSLPVHQVLDTGYLMRHTPAIRDLPIVEVPPLPPGSALIMNAFVVQAHLPALTGATWFPFTFPTRCPIGDADVYQLTVMPDRCRFDGQRNSWFSKDTHGPLYHLKEGDFLTDSKHFPVLYRALDIE